MGNLAGVVGSERVSVRKAFVVLVGFSEPETVSVSRLFMVLKPVMMMVVRGGV